jgi:GrpB-like predicted nucleotidyltransferase (UPF0157 family)
MPRIIVVGDYDQTWVAAFEKEATALAAIFGEHLRRIHHIGSTSIPGLCAKPIIDILVVLMEMTSRLFDANGGQIYFVELLASLEARIDREGTPIRASLKPHQEDVAAARARPVQFAQQYKMNTDGKLPLAYPHLIIDTEAMSPSEAAAKIQATFGLV